MFPNDPHDPHAQDGPARAELARLVARLAPVALVVLASIATRAVTCAGRYAARDHRPRPAVEAPHRDGPAEHALAPRHATWSLAPSARHVRVAGPLTLLASTDAARDGGGARLVFLSPGGITAVDAATLGVAWSSAARVGTRYIDGLVAHQHVVALGHDGRVELMDLARPRVVTSWRLADPVARLCRSPRDASRVWIHFVDDTVHELDVVAREPGPAPAGARCPDASALNAPYLAHGLRSADDHPCVDARTGATWCDPLALAPPVVGVNTHFVLAAGARRVLVTRDARDDVPTLVALAPDGVSLRWQRAVPASDPAAREPSSSHPYAAADDDRAYAMYVAPGGAIRLAAFWLETGERAWDVALAPHAIAPSAFVARHDRVVVVAAEGAIVLDAASGAALLTLG